MKTTRIPLLAIIPVLLAILAFPLSALNYASLKDGLKQLVPPGDKVFKTSVILDKTRTAYFNSHFGGGFREGDSFALYYTKDAKGAAALVIGDLTDVLMKYGAVHHWLSAVRADHTVAGVAILELTQPHAYPVAKDSFLRQLPGKLVADLSLSKGIDAMSGATESCQLLLDSFREVEYLITQAVFP